jgi:hypothetical protein
LSNTVRVHRKLRQAGIEAALHVYEGQSHAYFGRDDRIPRPGKPSRRSPHSSVSTWRNSCAGVGSDSTKLLTYFDGTPCLDSAISNGLCRSFPVGPSEQGSAPCLG